MWNCHKHPHLEVKPGFLLLLGILFWLDDGIGLLPWGLLACILHELGHIAVAAVFGGYVGELSLTAIGAELYINYQVPLTYGRDSLVALAGPTSNLLAGLVFTILNWRVAAALTLAVGVFNLLPIMPLDGGRVIYGLLSSRLDLDWAERLMTAISGCLIGVLVGVGMVAVIYYANITLFLTAIWLLFGMLHRSPKKFN